MAADPSPELVERYNAMTATFFGRITNFISQVRGAMEQAKQSPEWQQIQSQIASVDSRAVDAAFVFLQ